MLCGAAKLNDGGGGEEVTNIKQILRTEFLHILSKKTFILVSQYSSNV